jgi:hypothetical protein
MIAVALANLPATALAQNTRSQAPPYCFDLSRIVDLAVTKERFASIAERPRQGDFRDASVVLPDWKDCSLYGKVKMENKQCSICLRHFTEFGNKAWPINDGRCCNVCNDCLRPHLRARIAQSPQHRTTLGVLLLSTCRTYRTKSEQSQYSYRVSVWRPISQKNQNPKSLADADRDKAGASRRGG